MSHRKRKHSNNPNKNDSENKSQNSDLTEAELSKLIFGTTFNIEKTPDNESNSEDKDKKIEKESKERKPVWHDEDDDKIDVKLALNVQGRKLPKSTFNNKKTKYSNYLKNKFLTSVGNPEWANLDRSNTNSDSDDDILQTCGYLKNTESYNLPSNKLDIKKVRDLNHETYNEGPFINSVEFHPNCSVALVAGHSGIASLYAVDGKDNDKLHSVSFEKYPIFCSKFCCNEFILGSRCSFIYSYNLDTSKPTRITLPKGLTQLKNFIVSPDEKIIAAASKWGEIFILNSYTKEKIFLFKQDSECTALTFSKNGNLLFSHSNTGEVTVWDMKMTKIKHKFIDESCLEGTTLAYSSSEQFFATGSSHGVVNLYTVNDVLTNKTPKPKKSILNLTTTITDLKFNSTSEILALSSCSIKNAIRFYHLESSTVFDNFPANGAILDHVNVMNFSPNSGFIAFGNRKNKVFLYRLKHYKNY